MECAENLKGQHMTYSYNLCQRSDNVTLDVVSWAVDFVSSYRKLCNINKKRINKIFIKSEKEFFFKMNLFLCILETQKTFIYTKKMRSDNTTQWRKMLLDEMSHFTETDFNFCEHSIGSFVSN